MKTLLTIIAAVFAAAGAQAQMTLYSTYTNSTALQGSEIVVHDKGNQLLYNTFPSGVEILNFANPSAITQTHLISFTNIFSDANVTSVAVDPLGRGFGAATMYSTSQDGTTNGRVVFFNPTSGSVLGSVAVGYHPDMLTFSPDGTKLLVANEAEPVGSHPTNLVDRPGSVSVIDMTGVTLATVGAVSNGNVATVDFQGVPGLSSLRFHPNNTNPANHHLDVEPEFITVQGNRAFVSLQENNGIGVFNLASNAWEKVFSLGTINQAIDASDTDGLIAINDVIRGMPMPDGITSFSKNGTNYIVTANEGDARPPDGATAAAVANDTARVSQLGSGGRPPIEANYLAALNASYNGAAANGTNLGRLNVSLLDGLNGSGQITNLTMIGTRSFTIWTEDGTLVYDSGSNLETIVSNEVPLAFNFNGENGSGFDARSDDKGPEPEYVTLGRVGTNDFLFVGLERMNSIAQFNINDPNNPFFVDFLFLGSNFRAPEGLWFIDATNSPNSIPYLVVALEASFDLAIIAIPEPGAIVGLGLVALAFAAVRRRRK